MCRCTMRQQIFDFIVCSRFRLIHKYRCIRIFVLLLLIHGTYSCPSDQIYQKVTGYCCYPAFNCRPGTGVVFCSENGTNDTCTPCQGGKIQPQLVSSLDGIDAMCFIDDTQDNCNNEEVMPARDLRSSCGMRCICNNDNCYYGDDPCRCRKRSQSCSFDMTINKTTGECEQCPKYIFKNNTGCGPCYYNEKEWFNDHRYGSFPVLPLSPSSSATRKQNLLLHLVGVIYERQDNINMSNNATVPETGQDESLSSGVGISSAEVIAISIVICVGALIVVLLVYAFRRRRNEKWQWIHRKRQNRSAKQDPDDHNKIQRPILKVEAVVRNVDTPGLPMHVLNSVGSNRQAALVIGPTVDSSRSQQEEPGRHDTYVKEVVGSQIHNQEEDHQSGSIENFVLDPVGAASILPSNDQWSDCSMESTNKL